jgi:hypothetical protein
VGTPQRARWAQATYDKLNAEVPKYKLITPSVLSDRLRVRRPWPNATAWCRGPSCAKKWLQSIHSAA